MSCSIAYFGCGMRRLLGRVNDDFFHQQRFDCFFFFNRSKLSSNVQRRAVKQEEMACFAKGRSNNNLLLSCQCPTSARVEKKSNPIPVPISTTVCLKSSLKANVSRVKLSGTSACQLISCPKKIIIITCQIHILKMKQTL